MMPFALVEVGATSRPSRGAWIEIKAGKDYDFTTLSRPSRGAWIEISLDSLPTFRIDVAPLAGRVD